MNSVMNYPTLLVNVVLSMSVSLIRDLKPYPKDTNLWDIA